MSRIKANLLKLTRQKHKMVYLEIFWSIYRITYTQKSSSVFPKGYSWKLGGY